MKFASPRRHSPELLGMDQSEVSRLERRSDMLLSTLERFVEARSLRRPRWCGSRVESERELRVDGAVGDVDGSVDRVEDRGRFVDAVAFATCVSTWSPRSTSASIAACAVGRVTLIIVSTRAAVTTGIEKSCSASRTTELGLPSSSKSLRS
jgi:hypothetical protein